MMLVPALGGNFGSLFSEVRFIRGAGSDPWKPLVTQPGHCTDRLCRSIVLEQQFVANAYSWAEEGGPPWTRLFRSAVHALEDATRDERQFILWVDCFSTHEPWVSSYEEAFDSGEPISPPYGNADRYTSDQLFAIRRQYVTRLQLVDSAMVEFVQSLELLVQQGDVGIVVLSDHGFLFGEFGLVGKPKHEPVLPPLHDLVLRVSAQFDFLRSHTIQPIHLPDVVATALGFEFSTAAPLTGSGEVVVPHLIGRNSPEAVTMVVSTGDGFAVLFRDDTAKAARWFSYTKLNDEQPWSCQGESILSSCREDALLPAKQRLQQSEWGRRFIASMEIRP